jgi:hypothetical protein
MGPGRLQVEAPPESFPAFLALGPDLQPGDPCVDVDCSGHGTCYESGSSAICQCDTGFDAQGLECLPDGTDGDADADADVDVDVDVDTDADGDVDGDTDADGDADGDRDGDADADADADVECVLGPFSAPVSLPGFNTSADDGDSSISADGLTLYFMRMGTETGDLWEVWYTSRPDLDSPFVTLLQCPGSTYPTNGCSGRRSRPTSSRCTWSAVERGR